MAVSRTVVVTLGVVSVITGILVLAWPAATLLVLAVVIGVNFILGGIVSTVEGVTEDVPTGEKILSILAGLLSVLAGVVVVASPARSLGVIAVVIAAFWVVGGIAQLIAGIAGRAETRAVAIVSGVITVLAGAVVLSWPGITLLALVCVGGIWLVITGIVRVVQGLRMSGASQV